MKSRSNGVQENTVVVNHFKGIWQALMFSLLQNLEKVDKDDDELESNVVEATIRALISLIDSIGEEAIVPMTQYISCNNLANTK